MTDAPRPTRFAGESWRTASAMHARVVGAVIMRDLQTRFGAGYFGFLLGLLMPLGHLGIAMTITLLLRRPAALGSNTAIFIMTGVLPFIIWLYTHRQIMTTLSQNRPLLHFPNVDIFDLFMARIIVEIVNSTIVAAIVLSVLSITNGPIFVENWKLFISSLIYAWLFGVGTGLLFGSISVFVPIASIFGNILGPILWGISGIFFIPDELPDKLQNIIFYDPLAHIICNVRISIYSDYTSSFSDMFFIVYSILLLLICSMVVLLAIRRTS